MPNNYCNTCQFANYTEAQKGNAETGIRLEYQSYKYCTEKRQYVQKGESCDKHKNTNGTTTNL